MKIIVAWAGETGTHLTKLFSEDNHEITVIDESEERLNSLGGELDILTVLGEPTSISVLEKAGTGKADLFIAVTPSQDSNIVACILANRLGSAQTIARIDNHEYLQKAQRDFFTELGINFMIYPERTAAKEIENMIGQSILSDLVDFSGGKLSLLMLRIEETSVFKGKKLSELFFSKTNMSLRVVAIFRDGNTIIPRGDDMLLPNDAAYIVSNHAGIRMIMEMCGKPQKTLRNVMIMGGSRIGRMVAKDLEKHYNVKLLEADKDKAYRISNFLNHSLIIHGDGTKIDILLEEGLKNTDAFVAVTGNSETNILSCMLAKQEGVSRVIAEIENLDYLPLAQKMGIDSVINKKLITASYIFQFTLDDNISLVKTLTGATGAEVMEFIVKKDSAITRNTLANIEFPKGAIIGGVIRGDISFVADGNTHILPQDHVIVFTLPAAENKVKKMFS